EQVRAVELAAHGGEELVDVVGDEVQSPGHATGLLDRGDQQLGVRLVDLAREQRLPGGDELTPGGQHQDPRTAAHRQGGDADGGGQPQLGGAERRTRGEGHRTGGDVLTGGPQMAAGGQDVVDLDDLGAGVGELDRDDDVCPR